MKRKIVAILLLLAIVMSLTACELPFGSVLHTQYMEFTLLEDGTYSVKLKEGAEDKIPTRVVIPDTYNGKAVTVIEPYGFKGCMNSTHLVISNNITTIGDYAFRCCFDLTELKIPDSVVDIGNYAFRGTSITFVIIGKGIKTIGEGAFNQCFSLEHVYYRGNRTEWKGVSVGENNSIFMKARVYFDYSEEYVSYI